jgi:hypothetical protein
MMAKWTKFTNKEIADFKAAGHDYTGDWIENGREAGHDFGTAAFEMAQGWGGPFSEDDWPLGKQECAADYIHSGMMEAKRAA